MIINFFISIKLSFLLTLFSAVLFGDIITIWYDNNMLEEYLIINLIVLIIMTVVKMKQLKISK